MNRQQHILAIMQKELLHICRDKIALLIAFVAPFLLAALVGFLYIEQRVIQLPIVVFDQDQSALSRNIIRSFSDSEKFKITASCESYQELQDFIQTEKATMGVVIPPHLQRDVKAGRAREVALVINGTNLVITNTVANAANQIIQTISAGITMRVMQGYGITKQKAFQAVTALSFRTRIWYNPTMSYLVFMLLGLLGTVIQQVTFLGVALSFSREREQGTWRQLAASKLTLTELITGKLLLYFLIYTLDAVIIFGVGIAFFGLPMRGNALFLLVTIMIFILVLLVMGMAISILAKSTSQAIELSMLIAVPSFLVSGFTWPWLSMPWLIQFLSKLLPLTYFLEVVRGIVLMGSGPSILWPKLALLLGFALVFLPITAIGLHRRFLKAQ